MVVAGLKGGSGKTTLSLGLLENFKKSGKKIVPFKKGPDYIDPGWLSKAAGRPCYNLDAFLFPEKKVLASFIKHSSGAEGALIEGNRGLFDGMDEKGTFSTARLARDLSAPVILIIDCAKVTATIAAMVKGVLSFDEEIKIGGVVLNNIAGERHERVIRSAIEGHTDVSVVGAFRRSGQKLIEERHLGLLPQHESNGTQDVLQRMEELVAGSVNTEMVLRIMSSAGPLAADDEVLTGASGKDDNVRIGVMRDSAFQFYYPDNLELLKESGAEIIDINAFGDGNLPDIDALYIGGGFPETQAAALAVNRTLMKDIKDGADSGLPVYAECGGLMYLGDEIESGGETFKMAGVLPLRFSMSDRPVAHGYTEVQVEGDNPYFEAGTELKGHEFHYSDIVDMSSDALELTFRMKRGKGIKEGFDGITYRNVFATYTHLHALGSPGWVSGIIKLASKYRSARGTAT